MEIQRKRVRLDHEKDFLIGCVMSVEYLKEVYTILKETYHHFKSPYIKIVLGWIFEYYEENDKVPEESIQDIFGIKAETLHKAEDEEIIEDLLLDVSEKCEQLEKIDVPYLTKRTVDYCKKVSVLALCGEAKALAENGDVGRAEDIIGSYSKITSILTDGLDVDSDEADEFRDKLYSSENTVEAVRFPGALGELLGRWEYGSLHLIMASSKSGKSFTILDAARMCQQQGLKVAIFSYEMPKSKLIERLDMNRSKSTIYVDSEQDIDEYSYVSKRNNPKKEVLIPYFNENNEIMVKRQEASPLTAEKAKKAKKLFKKQYRDGVLQIWDAVSSGSTIDAIRSTLEADAIATGRRTQVCFIDSIYHLKGGRGSDDYSRWSDLHWRAKVDLAVPLNLVVCSPFQFNRNAKNELNPDESSMASSYSTFFHVNSSIFLRMTKEELAKGVMRIAGVGRDGNFLYGEEVIVTRCLDIGRGIIESRKKSEVKNYDTFIKEDITEMTEEDNRELEEMSMSLEEVE